MTVAALLHHLFLQAEGEQIQGTMDKVAKTQAGLAPQRMQRGRARPTTTLCTTPEEKRKDLNSMP